jgi:SAM-dependent methyltransferase
MEAMPEIDEHLHQMAIDAYALATRRCGVCVNLHALWPYLRIARIVSGVEGGDAVLGAAISEICTTGPKDVLIAGAADTGILNLVARTHGGRAAIFFVVDLCDTPLELCRKFAKRCNLRLKTGVQDVADIRFRAQFDVIIAHSLLQFISPKDRLKVFSRFAWALKPGGKFIQIFNTSRRIEPTIAADYHRHYPDWVMRELEAKNVPLPTTREAFCARLVSYAMERKNREGVVESEEEVLDLIHSAGFSKISCKNINLNLAPKYSEFVAQLSKRRYLTVASIPG